MWGSQRIYVLSPVPSLPLYVKAGAFVCPLRRGTCEYSVYSVSFIYHGKVIIHRVVNLRKVRVEITPLSLLPSSPYPFSATWMVKDLSTFS